MNSGAISLTAGDLRFEQGHLVMADYVAQAEPEIIGSFLDAELPGITAQATSRMTPPNEPGTESATVQTMQQVNAKVEAVLQKHSHLVGFEPTVGDHGMFYVEGQRLLVAVVYDYISGGYTNEEICNFLGLDDANVVAAVRAFISELL